MSAFGQPTYAELIERIEKLERERITLKDLPLPQLQRKLEQDWRPQPAILLAPRSITADLLAQQSVGGAVDAAGAVTQGDGFTVAKPGTGLYTIAFGVALATVPFVELTNLSAGGVRVPEITARSTAAFTVQWRNDGATTADAAFMFIAREI